GAGLSWSALTAYDHDKAREGASGFAGRTRVRLSIRVVFYHLRLLVEPERGPGLRGDIMPDLPERADIDQLRRKARDLFRAAVAGEPQALARLSAISERRTLAAAQLAIAREHGFPSWPALRSEVEARRRPTDWQLSEGTSRPETQDIALGRWSFGG